MDYGAQYRSGSDDLGDANRFASRMNTMESRSVVSNETLETRRTQVRPIACGDHAETKPGSVVVVWWLEFGGILAAGPASWPPAFMISSIILSGV